RPSVLCDLQLHRLFHGQTGARHGSSGAIGDVRQIHTSYVQGHNATRVEGEGAGGWRFDPAQCGPSLILGDIGTHAHHLGAFVSGLELEEVMAEVWASVPGRRADDAAIVLMRWS